MQETDISESCIFKAKKVSKNQINLRDLYSTPNQSGELKIPIRLWTLILISPIKF